jgi:hypothetical protein
MSKDVIVKHLSFCTAGPLLGGIAQSKEGARWRKPSGPLRK